MTEKTDERDADILGIRQTYEHSSTRYGVWRLAELAVSARDERDALREALREVCASVAVAQTNRQVAAFRVAYDLIDSLRKNKKEQE